MPSSVSKHAQYALIAYIAKKVGGGDKRLGKKALQKNVHLIQELGGVNTGYRFEFYTYGPYSSEVAADLDLVSATGGAKVQYNGAENYYLIEPGPHADYIINKGSAFINANRESINGVLEAFGPRMAKDLELVSTIAYLRRHEPSTFENEGNLIERVRALKPKYSATEVTRALDEVKKFLKI